MIEKINLPENLIFELFDDFRKGPILENKIRELVEVKFPEKINNLLSVYVYPKEQEPPHFNVVFQGESARFNLKNGEPMDRRLPRIIEKYKKNIKNWFEKNKEEICAFYEKYRPDDANPTSRICN